MSYCCDMMKAQADYECPDHPNPADCPDHVVAFDKRGRPIGLWIHDNGGSYLKISYCPWCGARLDGAES